MGLPPGEQLGQVVNDDGDEREVEVGDPAANVRFDKPAPNVVKLFGAVL